MFPDLTPPHVGRRKVAVRAHERSLPKHATVERAEPRPGRARRGDPATSKAGARSVAFRAGSQKARLLVAFASSPVPICDADAARYADLLKPGICYWKRCGELREDGLLERTGEEVESSVTGEQVPTSRLTEKGRTMVERLRAETP